MRRFLGFGWIAASEMPNVAARWTGLSDFALEPKARCARSQNFSAFSSVGSDDSGCAGRTVPLCTREASGRIAKLYVEIIKSSRIDL